MNGRDLNPTPQLENMHRPGVACTPSSGRQAGTLWVDPLRIITG
jgi:hypothetical protein